jgi:hypothetical protein
MNNSSSTSSSSPYSVLNPEKLSPNCSDEQMREFITKRIIKDRSSFIKREGGEDFVKYWNKDVMLEKLKEFKKIQMLQRNYDPKTLKYYLQHMFKDDEDIRPDYTVVIPWYPVDSSDFVE